MWFKKKQIKKEISGTTLREWFESNKDKIRETHIKIYVSKKGIYELVDYGRGINDLFYGKIIDWLDHTVHNVIYITDHRVDTIVIFIEE